MEDNEADGDSAVSAAVFEGYQAELQARADANWLQSRIKGVHQWLPISLAPLDGEEIRVAVLAG